MDCGSGRREGMDLGGYLSSNIIMQGGRIMYDGTNQQLTTHLPHSTYSLQSATALAGFRHLAGFAVRARRRRRAAALLVVFLRQLAVFGGLARAARRRNAAAAAGANCANCALHGLALRQHHHPIIEGGERGRGDHVVVVSGRR